MAMWIRKNDNYYEIRVKVFTYENGSLGIDLCNKATGLPVFTVTNDFCRLDNPGCCLLNDCIAWTVADVVEFLYDNDIAIFAGCKVVSNTERAYVFRCNLAQLMEFDPVGTSEYLKIKGLTKKDVNLLTKAYIEDQKNLILV